MLNVGRSSKIIHSQYNAESVSNTRDFGQADGYHSFPTSHDFRSVLPSPLSSSSSWSPRPRRSRTRHSETTASAGECIITKSSHAAKILRHLFHMVWLSVGFQLSSHRTSASRPTSMGIFIRQEHFAASCALLWVPLCPERLCNAETCLIRDFQITQTAHSSKSHSSGYRPRSRVGAGKITQVPVHKLATDLGLRHVDQVLEIVISHTGSSLKENHV